MRINLPIKAEIRGKAHSVYDAATIERRLAVLHGREDDAAREEVAFLKGLLDQLPKE
jgi:hypothetical protein